MAVVLVAMFPILMLINAPVACVSAMVGILLLYRDNRAPLVKSRTRLQRPAYTTVRGRTAHR